MLPLRGLPSSMLAIPACCGLGFAFADAQRLATGLMPASRLSILEGGCLIWACMVVGPAVPPDTQAGLFKQAGLEL